MLIPCGKGVVVLGVPCNDFGAQEPGSEKEVKTFCETHFSVDFPLTAKEHVIGAEAHVCVLQTALGLRASWTTCQ